MKARYSQTVVVLAVFILLFLAGYWYFVLPQLRELGSALKELAPDNSVTAQKNIDKEQRKLEIARTTEQALKLLPSDDAQYDLAVQMEAAAKNSGVTITALALTGVESTQPKTTSVQSNDEDSASKKSGDLPTAKAPTGPPAPTVKKVTASMGISGSYANVQQCIQRLTSLERFLQIDQISITAGAAGTTSAQLTAFGYYLPAQ